MKKMFTFLIILILLIMAYAYIAPVVLPKTKKASTVSINDPKFEYIGEFNDGYACFKENGKYGLIDTTGNIVVSPIWDNAGDFREGLIPVYLGGQWFFANAGGNTRITLQYGTPASFYNGLAIVKNTEGKSGLIDKKGKLICGYIWDNIYPFIYDVSFAQKDLKWYIINKKGIVISNEQYDDIKFTTGGKYIIALKGEKCGVLDASGKIILSFIYDYIGDYSQGMFNAYNNRKWQYININGSKTKLTIEADYASPFHNDVAVLISGDIANLIDRKGNKITKDEWATIQDSGTGIYVAKYKDGGYTYIDKNGNILNAGIFDFALPFLYDWAIVYNQGLAEDGSKTSAWTILNKDMLPIKTFTDNISLHFSNYIQQTDNFCIKTVDTNTGKMGFVVFSSSSSEVSDSLFNKTVDYVKTNYMLILSILFVTRILVHILNKKSNLAVQKKGTV